VYAADNTAYYRCVYVLCNKNLKKFKKHALFFIFFQSQAYVYINATAIVKVNHMSKKTIHDKAYKYLFSNPLIVKELLESFVDMDWVQYFFLKAVTRKNS